MLKKFLLTFFILNLFTFSFAQIKTPLEVAGKNRGKIKVLLRQQEPFVEARAFGRALGMQSTYFAASGRLELVENSKTALLVNKQPYVVINKQKKKLSDAPFVQDKILYAPLSFFDKFSFYNIYYQDDKLIVQRPYSLAFDKEISDQNSYKLTFSAKGELPFKTVKSSMDKVEIFFPGAIVQYDQTVSGKNNFLYRTKIAQKTKGVQIIFLLRKAAKYWDFYYNGKDFVFEASSKQIKRIMTDSEDNSEENSLVLARPSILKDNVKKETLPTADDSEIIELGEDFFAAAATANVATDTAEQKAVSAKTQTTAKPVPVPTVVAAKANKGKLKILIDPGHGGKDPGATRRGSAREKELNLKVAKQVYDILKKEKNVEVKMTRNDDTFISLGDRARMSVSQDSDIFVSIHTNAAKRAAASGFEVYFRSDKASDAEAAQTAALENEALQYEGKTSSGLSFADLLLQSLATNENINQSSKLAAHIRILASKESGKTGIKVFNNSAIKQANFYVLRGVSCPAVLVEMGYISNASDKKRLNNKNTQTLLAKTIAKGILTYAKEEGWK